MADDIEKIAVLSVELDVSQFSEAADQAAKDLDELLVKQSLLRAESKQGTVEYAALSDQIQKTRKSLKDNAAAAANVTKLQKENTGSIADMRKELSAATLQYNNLSKAERDNIAVGGKLKTQIKSLSDELKKNEGAIGDNRRNVGNYQQAIQGALQQTNLFGGSLSQLSGLLSSGGAFGAAMLGVVGIGKLLSDTFFSIDSQADSFQQKIGGLGAALKVFQGAIADTIGSKESGGLAKLFGINLTGFALLPAALTGRLEQAKEAMKVTETLIAATQSLNDAERDASNVISANNVLIDQYIVRSKNRTLSDKERLDILKQASKLEEDNLKKQQTIAESRLRIIRIENQLAARNQAGELTDEQKQREADAINEINKLRQESLSLQERISNREDQIAEAAIKRAESTAAKEKQLEAKRLADINERQNQSIKDRVNFLKTLAEEEKNATEQANLEAEATLKTQFANREITEKQFAERLIQIKTEALQRELSDLELKSGREIGLEDDIARKKIEIATFVADSKIEQNEKVTASAKKEADKQIKIAQEQAAITEDFITGIGQAFGNALTEQGLQVEQFADNVLLVVLDTLEKTITASIASATATSLAQPDSVATFGVTGITRAAILTGLIKAAFAVVKSQIGKDSGAKFAKGTSFVIGGKPHSSGGTKFVGSDGSRFEAEQGELLTIVNKRSTGMLNYLSNINKLGGGVDFFKTSPSNYMADGGFAARAISTPVEQQNNTLPPIFVLVEDINTAQGNKARVESRAKF